MASLLAICLMAGCKAHAIPPQSAQGSLDEAAMHRRIEVMVRAQFNVPED